MSKRTLPLFAGVLGSVLAFPSWLVANVVLIQIEVPLHIPPPRGIPSRSQLPGESLDPRFLSGRFALTREGKQHLNKTSDPFPGETNRVIIYTCPEVLNRTNSGNSRVVIDVSRQRVYLESGGLMALETEVSTARSDKHTPTGTFSMTERVRNGKVSTLYGVSMPYWMRLGDSEFGVHAGYLPGYPASAGCIRLPLDAARIIYEKSASGTPVTLTRAYTGPRVAASQLIDPNAKPPTGQVVTPIPDRSPKVQSNVTARAPRGDASVLPRGRRTPARRLPEPPGPPFAVDEYGQTYRRVRI